ncbi:hypothetical protein K7X08_006003 [Anisodus acutangulus]|uniref:Enhancer of polycomb-like protein n=1 Tax=Anisodus acutangulus TaxID=402998 RepID=A0A9Q1LUC5_9SOLA|nr:hypothetical protein K7X08_006003 [Anisodus acutangulus]
MPSVGGMRRTTRVFGARVLRSGRRLSSPPSEFVKRSKHGDDWIGLLDNVGGGGGGADATKYNKKNGWLKKDTAPKQEKSDQMDIDIVDRKTMDELEPETPVAETISPNNNMLRRWGAVYTRKRKRADSKRHDSVQGDVLTEGKRFGKHFVRKKKVRSAYAKDGRVSTDIVIVNTSYGSSYWVSCLLSTILRYLRRSTVSLQQIFGFINSKPLRDVYLLHGIFLLQDQTPGKMKTGACVISGVRCSVPVFALDFSTVPCCFIYMHTSLLLRFVPMSYALVMNHTVALDEVKLTNDKEIVSCLTPVNNQFELDSEKIEVVNPTVGLPKLGARHLQLRNSRNIQKRKSSLRSRNGRHSSFGTQNANNVLASDRLRFRRDGLRFSSRTSHYELRNLGQKTSKPSIKELKSALVGLTKDIDSTSCSANILVIEPDKCYREEGAVVAMELSAAKQWILAVRIGGVKRYNFITEKVMRPCSSNRVTHDIIWVGDSGWKLEFPDRQDWMIFKELYKECSDRNVVQPPAVSIIPAPGVREVSGYAESNPPDFVRPVSYIIVKDDELARALARSTANYDMDCDDEEWLRNFNDENEHLSAERFELLIDTFEKGFYCNPDDYSDEKAAISSCLDKEKKEIVEAVYSYWFKKRKQNRSSLIKIFQCYQPRRSPVIPKSILRKKRSFKRQRSQAGRGKQRPFLQAIVAEKDALQQQNAVLKVKEAKAAANKSEDLAVRMRHKAQQLMENADLATYKAMMALKIAEAAKIAKSTEAVASFFLG